MAMHADVNIDVTAASVGAAVLSSKECVVFITPPISPSPRRSARLPRCPLLCRAQDWYQYAVSKRVATWSVREGSGNAQTSIPIITYAIPQYDVSQPSTLIGVVAADLIIARFVSQVVGFVSNVSPNGEVRVPTRGA